MLNPLLERARSKGTPLIDGSTATFVWEGPEPARVIADFNGWEDGVPGDFERVSLGLWKFSVDLPLDAYVEYVLEVNGERVFDPFNRRRTDNGFGKFNHYFYMPQAGATNLNRSRKGFPRGKITAVDIDGGWFMPGRTRRVIFYQPPVDVPCPLVVVWDGQDYLRRVQLPTIIDNLVGSKRIRPVALAMVESSFKTRAVEYMCSDATIAFVQRYLLPAAKDQLNLVELVGNPGAYATLGASAGGLMALYTGLRMPTVFGKVLAQSGGFTIFGHDMVVWDLIRWSNPSNLKIWLTTGSYDMLLACNRKMAALLQERGFDYHYDEYRAGHNYPAWRDNLWKGLEYIFGA